jgi:hypothetical protein
VGLPTPNEIKTSYATARQKMWEKTMEEELTCMIANALQCLQE